MLAFLQLLIEIVEQDVREERAQWPALWHSAAGRFEVAVKHHDSGPQVFSDQGQDAPVFDSALQPRHQRVVIDDVEERFQIAVDDPFSSTSSYFRLLLHGLDRIVGTSCRTETKAVVAENRFV